MKSPLCRLRRPVEAADQRCQKYPPKWCQSRAAKGLLAQTNVGERKRRETWTLWTQQGYLHLNALSAGCLSGQGVRCGSHTSAFLFAPLRAFHLLWGEAPSDPQGTPPQKYLGEILSPQSGPRRHSPQRSASGGPRAPGPHQGGGSKSNPSTETGAGASVSGTGTGAVAAGTGTGAAAVGRSLGVLAWARGGCQLARPLPVCRLCRRGSLPGVQR